MRYARDISRLVFALWLLIPGACSDSAFTGKGAQEDEQASEINEAQDGGKTNDKGLEIAQDETADSPVWINGSMLTCDWVEAVNADDVRVSCGAKDPEGNRVAFDPRLDARWEVREDGKRVDVDLKEDAEGVKVVMAGSHYVKRSIRLSVASGDDREVLEKEFRALLPGLDGKELPQCLEGDTAAATCLEDYLASADQTTPGKAQDPIVDSPIGDWYLAIEHDHSCPKTCAAAGKMPGISPDGHACASRDLRPESAVGKLAFLVCSGSCSIPTTGIQNGMPSGKYCFGQGQRQEEDPDNLTVGCYCQ